MDGVFAMGRPSRAIPRAVATLHRTPITMVKTNPIGPDAVPDNKIAKRIEAPGSITIPAIVPTTIQPSCFQANGVLPNLEPKIAEMSTGRPPQTTVMMTKAGNRFGIV